MIEVAIVRSSKIPITILFATWRKFACNGAIVNSASDIWPRLEFRFRRMAVGSYYATIDQELNQSVFVVLTILGESGNMNDAPLG